MMNVSDFLIPLAAYLFGSVPYGFLAGKLCGLDLRKVGSGNIASTNVMRTLGKKWGYSVFFLDFMKGFIPVWIVYRLGYSEYMQVIASVLVIVGHNFPIWLGFRGGKGIATSGGVILALFPLWIFSMSMSTWIILFLTTRYVSVASLGAAVAITTTALVLGALNMMTWFLVSIGGVISLLGILRHRGNISRLLAGTEPKFVKKKKTAPPTDASNL